MSLYTPETVTLWAIQAESPESLDSLFEFPYDGEGETVPSPFAQAYGLDWYDEDFAELNCGASAEALLVAVSQRCRTLDEQALRRLPQGDWNGIYLIYGQAGEEWQSPEARPPMPHNLVEIENAKFRLVDTFHVVIA